jgi:hypothetical protein
MRSACPSIETNRPKSAYPDGDSQITAFGHMSTKAGAYGLS